VENVVNAPMNPMSTTLRASAPISDRCAATESITPNTKQPVQLTTSVPQGNVPSCIR